MDRIELQALFDKWCQKLRIVPAWDVRLEFGEEKELSYGRCKGMKSYNELFEGLKNI